jgi:hypothetical protein
MCLVRASYTSLAAVGGKNFVHEGMLFIELKFWNYVEMNMMRCRVCIRYTAGTAWHVHKMSETA